MIASFDARLTSFNRQVLQRQEEAYTFAYYLLGSSEAAAKAVQDAILQFFRQAAPPERLRLLRAVLSRCKWRSASAADSYTDPLYVRLLAISVEERRAVLLVDVLGLSYNEAAQVLGTTTSRVSQWLAQGRVQAMV